MGGVVKAATSTIGGIVGGVVGGIGGGAANEMSGGGPAHIGNSTGLDLNYGKQIADRNQNTIANQNQLDQMLTQTLAGNGPSAAQSQLQAATDQNIAQQASMAASARGPNQALAQRAAMMNGAQIQQQAVNQAATLRAQEMQQAQQNMMSNLQNKDAFTSAMTNAGTARDTGQGTLDEASKKRFQEAYGSVMSGVGAGVGAIAASDKNMKKDIQASNENMDSFLDALKAYTYEYKDEDKKKPGAGSGKFSGVMAQDLEKSKLGKGMVMDTPDGKMVDYGKGFGLMLAANARLNERLKKLEEKA